MSKGINAIFGIAVAVVVYLVLILGIQAFYPEPVYEEYCNNTSYESKPVWTEGCDYNITVKECLDLNNESFIDSRAQARTQCYDTFNEARKDYEGTLFLITATLGILVIIIAFFTLTMINISSGLIMSGVVLIVYGFIRGWSSTNDITKFIFAIIDATIIISFAVYLNKKKK